MQPRLPESITEKYPMPAVGDIAPYYFSLDGGGRETIVRLIQTRNVRLMLEIGCFFCGSTIQWLKASEDVVVVGVDPWNDGLIDILEQYDRNPACDPFFAHIENRNEFLDSARRHGAYLSAMANVKKYDSRFVPVRAASPGVLYELHADGLKPDLVYIDGTKSLEDLVVCDRLFPEAILSGDDWTWGRDGRFPVREAVTAFCKKKGYQVHPRHATWYVSR